MIILFSIRTRRRQLTQCEQCSAIGIFSSDSELCDRCTRLRARDDDYGEFVERSLQPGSGILSRLDSELMSTQRLSDHHLRHPLTAADIVQQVVVASCASPTSETCAVCLDDIVTGVPVTRECGHRIHRECYAQLQPGLIRGVRCPICRNPVARPDLPWDTTAAAVLTATRRVEAVLLGTSPLDLSIDFHDVAVYHVCAMQIINVLIDKRYLQWSMLQCNLVGFEIDQRIGNHVKYRMAENQSIETVMSVANED